MPAPLCTLQGASLHGSALPPAQLFSPQSQLGLSKRRRMLLTQVMWFSALCTTVFGCPTIITRSQWGARAPRDRVQLSTPVPYVIIHHTAGSSCISQASCSQLVRGIQNYHMDSKGWADIGYNFLIGEDSRVYEGRGWSTMGAHAKNWNHKSLGFSFLGTFSSRVPSAAALNIAQDLIQCAVNRGSLSSSYTLKGHRNVNPTECPGNALYRDITQWPRFKAWGARQKPHPSMSRQSGMGWGRLPTIITRSQCGARAPRNRVPLSTPVPYVIIYHTAGSSCISQASCSQLVRSIQNYHMDSNGWADIGYNFLIGEDGRVYEGRGWSTWGTHASAWNDISLGFSLLGTFSSTVPSAAALNIAQDLIQCAVNMGSLSSSYILKGHRNVKETESPGEALYVITQWPRFQT
ncbi:LOW QUALITY PROTEIN: peptidoglycan recognition protein 3-like [Gopherus evgoodei]|uniref:LOW QUALITY PROTEIN: peptidoglycan recognition protein 3-like n=1 Tax=Gopherus evgoodei TaxID=1825980 RepID=UPI0011D02FC3|nr:LOW QUALITY PROTEIN: peptidoglycan recognition protein 3-like [Gopherus evgoodei]